jgi:hypothetical protein
MADVPGLFLSSIAAGLQRNAVSRGGASRCVLPAAILLLWAHLQVRLTHMHAWLKTAHPHCIVAPFDLQAAAEAAQAVGQVFSTMVDPGHTCQHDGAELPVLRVSGMVCCCSDPTINCPSGCAHVLLLCLCRGLNAELCGLGNEGLKLCAHTCVLQLLCSW